ncbi:MAG: flagellar assembly protein FliH [Steroidobacteraceae bacterium]
MSEMGRTRPLAAATAAAAERWSLPCVEGPILGARREPGPDARERAIEAERARGYEAGIAAGRAESERLAVELGARSARLDSLLGELARPLVESDAAVDRQLLLLALAIGKQLARREIKADPAAIIGVIREAVGRLPAAARDVRIRLHPDDAALVREHLAEPRGERAWTLVEDPSQARGGCLVLTESSRIDLRLETRINAIAASLLGDERAREREAPAGADAGAAASPAPAAASPTEGGP